MDRIFQHYEGNVKDLEGVTFTSAKSMEDTKDNDVLLLWLKDINNNWYRIFIDGAYCGIDLYNKDQSNDDLDDHIIIKDVTNLFNQGAVKSASVKNEKINNRHIVLSFKFGEKTTELICESSEGECKLVQNGTTNA